MSQILLTAPEVQLLLGQRLKALRLGAELKRSTLTERSGVSTRSLQRFEDSGEISLKSLLRLAHALGVLSEFCELLEPPPARSMEELEARTAHPPSKRGRI